MSAPIWLVLIGQEEVVTKLERAVHDAELMTRGESGPAMTHAWLFTGPPGSGRSNAATSFAAALVCIEGGCGECQACRNASTGGHPDVDIVRPQGLSYGVDEARDLIKQAAMSPTMSQWHVVVVEDADRLTDQAVNVLLKAIEEPPPHTVWILCAPSAEDVLPTILSRTRQVVLRTPPTKVVMEALIDRYGVDAAVASFAARASQGHIGRARALATDEHTRLRRHEVLRIPMQLHDLPACFTHAANLLEAANLDAKSITDPLDEHEQSQLRKAFGADSDMRLKGQLKRSLDSSMKQLEAQQKRRRTRTIRDQVDRALVDLLGLYRDVLLIQTSADIALINEEMRPALSQLASQTEQQDTGRRLLAVNYTRKQIDANVTPLIALEALMVELKDPWLRVAS
ncbi:MAG: DNA polymerase III subunit delta' [Actinomycetota bacterium]|nr:DNA polymerase III subunit delta' [Actinomycetota bacterium]